MWEPEESMDFPRQLTPILKVEGWVPGDYGPALHVLPKNYQRYTQDDCIHLLRENEGPSPISGLREGSEETVVVRPPNPPEEYIGTHPPSDPKGDPETTVPIPTTTLPDNPISFVKGTPEKNRDE